MGARVFAFEFSPWLRWAFAVIGAGPRRSRVELSDDELVVRMGWGFRARIARSTIRTARRDRDIWWAIGVHSNFAHSWLVNGSPRGIVQLELDPRASARCLGVPITVKRLGLGLKDPADFLSALGEAAPTTT